MVLEIVKQAVKIKTTCKNESLLISPAEYVYACVFALKQMGKPAEQVQMVKNAGTIEGLRVQIVPYFEERLESVKDEKPKYRLLHLLINSKVEGGITDEIRKLMDEI